MHRSEKEYFNNFIETFVLFAVFDTGIF